MTQHEQTHEWRAGKLPAEHLDTLFASLPQRDSRVILGPSIGEDAAVLDMGDRYLVAASDPVTFATERVGWYAVHVNANDVAVLGAKPRWFLAVLMLPEGTNATELSRTIMDDIGKTCGSLGVTVCGGHTEVTAGLDRPIVVGHMLGEVQAEDLIRKDQLVVGDQVIMTHGVAIEGTALIAREKRADLERRVPHSLAQRAAALLFNPGISVVAAAQVAREAGEIHAMHDPTEGGINAALVELVTPSGLGLDVYQDRIPVLDETSAICKCFDLDPMGLLASGSLLLATPQRSTTAVTTALEAKQIPTAIIGEIQPAESGIRSRQGKQYGPLVAPRRDELARLSERGPSS